MAAAEVPVTGILDAPFLLNIQQPRLVFCFCHRTLGIQPSFEFGGSSSAMLSDSATPERRRDTNSTEISRGDHKELGNVARKLKLETTDSEISLMEHARSGDQSAIHPGQDPASSQRNATSQSHGEGMCARRRMIKYKRYNKPPYAYLAMIILAIQNSPYGHMTLAEIIKALECMFPFFRGSYKGWKDSVRHNISNSRCIVKMKAVPGASVPSGKATRWRVCWDLVPRDVFLLQRGRPGCKEKHWKPTLQQYLGLPDLLLPSQYLASSKNPFNQSSMSHTQLPSKEDSPSQAPVFKTEPSSPVTQYNEHFWDLSSLSSLVRSGHSRNTLTSSSTTEGIETNGNLQACNSPNIYRFAQNSTLPHPVPFLPQVASDWLLSEDDSHSAQAVPTTHSSVDHILPRLPQASSATDMPLSPRVSRPAQATSSPYVAGHQTTSYHRYLDNFLFYGPKSPELDFPPIDVCSYQEEASGYRNQLTWQHCAVLSRGVADCRQSARPASVSSDRCYVTRGFNNFVMETNSSAVQRFNLNHRRPCTTYGVSQALACTSLRADSCSRPYSSPDS